MGQRLFAAVAPPTSPNLNDAGTDYTLSTLFRADVDGFINGIYWFTPTDRNATAKAALFQRTDDTTGTEIARIDPFTVTVDGAWSYTPFAAPVAITALQWYYAAIWTPGQYVATSNFFTTGAGASGITSGNLHSPSSTAGRGNGRFFAGAADLTYPNDDFNGGFYHIDVDFTPASVAATQGIWGVSR